MGKLLDGIFTDCSSLNNGVYEIFNCEETRKCDGEIKCLKRDFERSIEDEELKKQILKFYEVLEEAYTERDCVISRLLVTHGMALNIQLMTEILTSK